MTDTADGTIEPGDISLQALNQWGVGRLPGLLGIRIDEVGPGMVVARLDVRHHHLAPNGFLHGGAVVTLADTACGYGTVLAMPEGSRGFTTVEMKSNFLATVREGVVVCSARLEHGGRTTQVWAAEVRSDTDQRLLGLFRCTQLLLSGPAAR